MIVVLFFFFFKQKTAYEMRISDWSSDVCSSDLFNCGIDMAVVVAEGDVAEVTAALEAAGETVFRVGHIADGAKGCTVTGSAETWSAMEIGRASCRERVCQYV